MIIGLVGAGVTGGAMLRWLKAKTKHDVRVYDGPKGIQDDFRGVKAIFICLPAPTLPTRKQDLSLIRMTLENFKFLNVPFFLRSTVLPGTCDMLSNQHATTVYAMPEFLTERTSDQDFNEQDIVSGGPADIVKEIFKGKEVHSVSNTEAEIAKYAHNCFGAVKVHYFNSIYDLCKIMRVSYEAVLRGVLMSGYINDVHTKVPGPDGKQGFGGKCFPKDLSAFIGLMKEKDVTFDYLRFIEHQNDMRRGN